ncbi:MAG: Fructose-bisphosphate aldolase [Berkelbacteria bacterium GW2011_GWA2_38_9]|uniref:Fructose-bisphosphate aldolase n=1 Tax=Berkelbacteria bacterium GW2011_GWA2_38_9 TaxID=1618334 RepID=A0A0G0LRC9_9BACT|nr:MAG: Fructose-bisphosphate aldolase [Berkelbacteria bacterium GW2011_GWA2_38_9]
MIVSLNDILPIAQKKKYAIPAFNTFNLEVTQGILAAAEIEKSPVIISVSEKSIEYAGLLTIYQIIFSLASKSKIPVVIHLDHGKLIELVQQVIDQGFSSVMYDGSKLEFSENIKNTAKVVNLAHRSDISVEGELGTIGGQEDKTSSRNIIYANPKDVLEFVDSTNVDALAVALGTSHGLPVRREHVDFDLLQAIRQICPIPLVLHGASNLSPKILTKAAKNGISKVNIDTELRQGFTKGVREILDDKKLYDPRAYLSEGRLEIKKIAARIINILGSNNKA